jgi:hypothetical protein
MDVGQTAVAKYMAKRRRPPSQGWRTFVHDHADAIASLDMFVAPTISFGLLYGLLILRQSRRELLWPGVTAYPNAEWLARQLTEACGWDEPPRYLIRDRGRAYGAAFIRRVAAMGIRDRPTSARSPWQNGYAERLIGSIRREYLDHVVVVGERHLRHVLASYQKYYNEVRTHLSLQRRAGSASCVPNRAPAFVADPGRATPSICSSLSFRKGQGSPINRSGRSRVPAKLVRKRFVWCMIRANALVRPKAALHSLPVIAQPSKQRSGQYSFHRNGDLLRYYGWDEGVVPGIAEHQLERMLAGWQFNTRLSLSSAEMEMFLVLWDRLVCVKWFIYVDQQMMMPAVWGVTTRLSHAHVTKAKPAPKRTLHSRAIRRPNNVKKGFSGCSSSLRGRSNWQHQPGQQASS